MIQPPSDASVEIVRSFSRKCNLGNYQSADFFCSAKSYATISSAESVSAQLYRFCLEQVEQDIQDYARERRGEDSRDAAPAEPPPSQPQQNPLTVRHEESSNGTSAPPQPEPPQSPLDQKATLNNLVEQLCASRKGCEPKMAANAIRRFIAAFLRLSNISAIPTVPHPDLDDPVSILPALVRDYPGKLLSEPVGLGNECRDGWEKLKKLVGASLWPAASFAAAAQYPDNPSDLLGFIPEGERPQGDILAFLACCRVGKACAAKLRDTIKGSWADAVAHVNWTIVTEENLLAHLDKVKR